MGAAAKVADLVFLDLETVPAARLPLQAGGVAVSDDQVRQFEPVHRLREGDRDRERAGDRLAR